jgi:hypothetical protein
MLSAAKDIVSLRRYTGPAKPIRGRLKADGRPPTATGEATQGACSLLALAGPCFYAQPMAPFPFRARFALCQFVALAILIGGLPCKSPAQSYHDSGGHEGSLYSVNYGTSINGFVPCCSGIIIPARPDKSVVWVCEADANINVVGSSMGVNGRSTLRSETKHFCLLVLGAFGNIPSNSVSFSCGFSRYSRVSSIGIHNSVGKMITRF